MKTEDRHWLRLSWVMLSMLSVLLLAIGGATIWLSGYTASQQALDALHSGNGVTVTSTTSDITFMPQQQPTVGLIFYPGARVQPEAYAHYMRVFAEHGYAAFILRVPFDVALLGTDLASNIIVAHPDIKQWVVGGHSLGGVSACTFALQNTAVKGLLLYASYPNDDLSKETRLHITSISGSNDGLATPAKVDAAKPRLPSSTKYVVVQGGVHAFFGDYGPQDGDGQPSISREAAQSMIVDASLVLLDSVKG